MPAFRPSFSLEREGSEERRDLNWRGGGKEGVLPAIRDALLLNRTKKKKEKKGTMGIRREFMENIHGDANFVFADERFT